MNPIDGGTWYGLGSFVGNNIASFMSKAAIAVIEAVVDTDRYHKENKTSFE
jgi:hypothetical protein